MNRQNLNPANPGEQSVRVWDPLVRIFHWSLATSFFAAYLLGEDGGSLHQSFGYAALGLVSFRLLWGVVGPQYARFTSFVPSVGGFFQYARDVAAHRETRFLGHNPAGPMMILALLGCIIATGATGWMMTTSAFAEAEWVEDIHEALAGGTLALVGLHVGGVIFSSLRHHENLVKAMFTGRKRAE